MHFGVLKKVPFSYRVLKETCLETTALEYSISKGKELENQVGLELNNFG
jgi:hypothetical protein